MGIYRLRFWLFLNLLLLSTSVWAGMFDPPVGIQDEGGTEKKPVYTLNCVGAGITCSQSGITATLTVAGGGSGGGGTNFASHNLLSGLHADTATGSVVRGDLLSGQGTTPRWSRLPLGPSNSLVFTTGVDVGWTTQPVITSLQATDTVTGFVLTATSNVTGTVANFSSDVVVGNTASNGVVYANTGGVLKTTSQGGSNTVLTANAGAPSFSSQPILTSLTATGTVTGFDVKATNTVTGTNLVATSNVTAGQSSTTTGLFVLKNSTNSNNLTLRPGATGGNLTFTLPTTDGTNNQALVTNGSATLSFANMPFVIGTANVASFTAAFFSPVMGDSYQATEANALMWQFPFAWSCKGFRANVKTAPGAGVTWTATFRHGASGAVGNDANQKCTIAGASATSCSVSAAAATGSAGDYASVGWTVVGTPATTGAAGWSIECETT